MSEEYLLDTHALIWYQGGSTKLSKKLVAKIQNKENEIFFSQISLKKLLLNKK